MSVLRSKSLAILVVGGILLLGAVAVLRVSLRARQVSAIARLKVTGSLPDIGWTDLFRLSRSHFNLPEVATTLNPYASIRSPFTTPDDVAAGNGLFQSHCASCHGPSGAGGPGGPSLQHRQMAKGSSDWAIFQTIAFGIPKTPMPASNLPWLDKWRLIAYVKSLMVGLDPAMEAAANARIRALEPVRYEDIRTADQAQNRWLTYSGSYDAHRFSSISQITPANAAGLRLLWTRQYNTSEPALETSPLIVDGIMFVTVPPARVEALNAETGALIWAYDRQMPDHLSVCCGYPNRGLAVLGSTLFFGTLDAHLVALDIRTGQVRWDVEIADYKAGYTITGAPLALKNLVVTGVAGGEFGIRGFVEALDSETGKSVWKFYTVPQPGQPGSETWAGNSWKTGGSPTWITGSFDPESNLIYWPTGNPSPNFEEEVRKGDNLYSNSVLALDADRGTLQWYFQFTPHDAFDWDATEILVLFDANIGGKRQRYLAQANRNGFYYVLNRDNGQLHLARPFAQENWSDKTDSIGRPLINPASYPSQRGTLVYPSAGGATNWESPSFSPSTGFFYVSAIDSGAIFFEDHSPYRAGDPFYGGTTRPLSTVRPKGAVRALNAVSGELQWEFCQDTGFISGLLSTQGGLVFGGQDKTFFALDAATGRELWHVETGGLIHAAPVTFLYSGKQMVTIAAGHDLLTFGL